MKSMETLYKAWQRTKSDVEKAEKKWKAALAKASDDAEPLRLEKKAKEQMQDAASRRLMNHCYNHKGWTWDGEKAPIYIGPTKAKRIGGMRGGRR